VTPWYDAEAAAGLDEVYWLVIDGEDFTLASARAGTRAAVGREPDLVLIASARVILAARHGETTLAKAIADGALKVEGSQRTLRNFQTVFHLP
jgi:putative sterol carrier protein